MIRIILGLVIAFFPFGFGFGVFQLIGFALIAWGFVSLVRGKSADTAFGQGFKYSFTGGRTGIAVSPERRVLKLKVKSKTKEYPFDQIRSWQTNLQTGGMAVHGGSSLTGATNVGAANMGQLMANKRASGLFVYTKDIENTEWRIEILRKDEQAKWMEILQQCINEA